MNMRSLRTSPEPRRQLPRLEEQRGRKLPNEVVCVPVGLPVFARSRRDMLIKLRRELVGGVCAEIGILQGAFTLQILSFLAPSKMYAIDHWKCDRAEQHEKAAREALAGRQNVVIIKQDSHVACEDVPDCSLDLGYVDAGHHKDAIKRDLGIWWPKIKPGRYLSGHDFCTHSVYKFGVVEAVFEFIQEAGAIFVGMTAWSPEEFPSFLLRKSC